MYGFSQGITVFAVCCTAQPKQPRLLTLGPLCGKLFQHALCLVIFLHCQIRLRQTAAQPEIQPCCKLLLQQPDKLALLDLCCASLHQTGIKIFAEIPAVSRQYLRIIGLGCIICLMALQGQISLLGDLRHRRRGIMYDLAVLIHTRLLQQIIILHRVIVQHRENQLTPLT